MVLSIVENNAYLTPLVLYSDTSIQTILLDSILITSIFKIFTSLVKFIFLVFHSKASGIKDQCLLFDLKH